MKRLLLSIISILAIGLLVTSSGFAYPTWTNGASNGQGGCNTCHPTTAGTGVHTLDSTAHQTCSNCHPNGDTTKPPTPAACLKCHPAATAPNSSPCPLIKDPIATGHGATCLTSQCHGPTCAAANTTTTTPAGTTTTTSVSETTTTTTPAGPCPAEATLGEDDPRLDTLRTFRDEVLAKSPNGQKLITLYYKSSKDVVELLEKNPDLKRTAKDLLEAILPAIEQMTNQKAKRK